MAKNMSERINDVETNQGGFYNSQKNNIIHELDSVDSELDQTYNEILASILGKDVSEISDKDFVGDKLEYLKYMAEDKESLSKISDAEEKIKENKEKTKAKIIKLLKFKAELFKQNEKLISELEEELVDRRKESTKLNETIIEDEQEVDRLNAEIEMATKNLEVMDTKEKAIEDDITRQIEALTDVMKLKKADDPTLESDNKQLNALNAQLESAKADYDGSYDRIANEKTIIMNTKYLNTANSRLKDNRDVLEMLAIDKNQDIVTNLKKANMSLYNSIETDILAYQKSGIDIEPEDLNTIKKAPSVKNEQQIKVDAQTQNIVFEAQHQGQQPIQQKGQQVQFVQPVQGQQPIQQQGQQVQFVQPIQSEQVIEQQDNLPVPITQRQIANNLKNKILNGSYEEGKEVISSNEFDDLVASIPSFNRREKKALAEKVGTFNTTMDSKKLQNVVTALSRSGICSDFSINGIITGDGKLKDFKDISDEDFTKLNTFITELSNNKDYVNDEQLEFLQDGLINNIKSISLSHSLKPKALGDFFKRREEREKAEYVSLNVSELCSNLSGVNKENTRHSKLEKIDSFYQNLFGQTNDAIDEYPPKNKDEQSQVR